MNGNKITKVSTFTERFHEALRMTGLSKIEVARRLGVDRAMMSKYSIGMIPRPDRLEQLADVFGVSVAWLSGYDTAPEKETVVQYKNGAEYHIFRSKLTPVEVEIIDKVTQDENHKRMLLAYAEKLAELSELERVHEAQHEAMRKAHEAEGGEADAEIQ